MVFLQEIGFEDAYAIHLSLGDDKYGLLRRQRADGG